MSANTAKHLPSFAREGLRLPHLTRLRTEFAEFKSGTCHGVSIA